MPLASSAAITEVICSDAFLQLAPHYSARQRHERTRILHPSVPSLLCHVCIIVHCTRLTLGRYNSPGLVLPSWSSNHFAVNSLPLVCDRVVPGPIVEVSTLHKTLQAGVHAISRHSLTKVNLKDKTFYLLPGDSTTFPANMPGGIGSAAEACTFPCVPFDIAGEPLEQEFLPAQDTKL